MARANPKSRPPWLAPVIDRLEEILERLRGTHKTLLTTEELAREVGRSADTIRRWISEGRLRAHRVDGSGARGRLLVARAEVDRLLTRGPASTPEGDRSIASGPSIE